MSSPPKSPANRSVMSDPSSGEDEQPAGDDTITLSDVDKRLHPQEDDTESLPNGCLNGAPASPSATSPPPADIPPFDWEDFEARYESALKEADGEEKEILKEAESLSKYFQAWASAASEHDDERAVKRLRTRQRFVNLSEEKMAQKQKHYEEVVRAFESALALLKSS
ncbi:hypothetical protein C2857_003228 [Epichloe festucae Fl1]|uniref:Uncharacterized protein n=1 Tax=Epichloe festucae (strain Fl1) TaxID=877507 RepID=A0A7S9KNQ6_EPIFF|nr:hypothetical protein C2857_003228 [Epichloe festucae Fl1]